MAATGKKTRKKPVDFRTYKAGFDFRGKAIYHLLFELHSDNIKTKKPRFAVNNLEKIFNATFKIASKTGFHEMSLRDLSRETGISMGGIYSCIESKDMIAIMVKDVVKKITGDIIADAVKQGNKKQAIDDIVLHLLYTTEILQHWFHFLYFETRSLPTEHQEDSKQIELQVTETVMGLLSELYGSPKRNHYKYRFIATMTLALVQERYLKHWKYKNSGLTIDDFGEEILRLVHAALK